jgi:hypothetical protein
VYLSITESPEFYLAYNPLECDCRTDWLAKMEELSLTGPYPAIMDMDRLVGTSPYRALPRHQGYGQE